MKRWMKSNSCHRSSLIGVRSGLTATMPRTKMPSRELPFSIRAPGGKPKPLGGIYDSVAIATCYGTYGTLAGRFQTFLFDRFIIIYYVPESLKMLFKISSAYDRVSARAKLNPPITDTLRAFRFSLYPENLS